MHSNIANTMKKNCTLLLATRSNHRHLLVFFATDLVGVRWFSTVSGRNWMKMKAANIWETFLQLKTLNVRKLLYSVQYCREIDSFWGVLGKNEASDIFDTVKNSGKNWQRKVMTKLLQRENLNIGLLTYSLILLRNKVVFLKSQNKFRRFRHHEKNRTNKQLQKLTVIWKHFKRVERVQSSLKLLIKRTFALWDPDRKLLG